MPIIAQSNRPLPLSAPGVLARRLLTAALCFAGIIAGIICIDVREARESGDHQLSYGHDLLPSYVAGAFIREGHPRDMYDIEAVHQREAQIVRSADLALDRQGGPWLNPPFYAWIFAPLSALTYRQASAVFLGFNLLLLSGSLLLLVRQLPIRDWRLLLVPLVVCTSMPFWQALCHQQNSFISLFLLSLVVTFWREARPFAAGCIAGILFFKPQLAVAVSLVVIATMGRRALTGIALSGLSLLAITLITLPGTLLDFLTKLSPIVRVLQADPQYNWGRQDTLQSFWRLLLNGHIAGPTPFVPKLLTWAGAAIVGIALIRQTRAVVRLANEPEYPRRLRRLISATIVSMPLLMPYYMDYDLLLLAVPAVLFAEEWLSCRRSAGDAAARERSAEEPRMPLSAKAFLLRLFSGPYVGNPTRNRAFSSSPRTRGEERGGGPTDPAGSDFHKDSADRRWHQPLQRWQLALWIALFFATQISPGLAGQTRFNIAVPLLVILCGITLRSCTQAKRSFSAHLPTDVLPDGGRLAA
jgi:hypothetical protein